ncbi:MAG: LysR family transcriptional regulator [Rhizobiaceae bacterium]|nr:LysR family transcriptional regulator [Rhizobiaceae bacterium]
MPDLASADVKLRQLQILREVLRSGSERYAARLLKISQPAVSQQIKQLEAALGLKLFLREKNRLIPTHQAWELYRDIEVGFASLDRVGRSVATLKGEEPSAISLAAPGIFCFRLLPQVVRALRNRDPSHSAHIRSGSYQQTAEHILNGRADLGISRLPLDERIFEWQPVATARNICLFHPEHRFAAKELVVAEDLVGEPLIDIEPQFSAHQMNINALRYMGVEPDIAVEFDASGHDAGFVAAGIGVSITNQVIAREYGHFGLSSRPFEPGAVYHYVVFWRRGRTLDDRLRFVVESVARIFRDDAR